MDREPEQLKFMGIFAIYKEAYKITVTWKKLFTQITLSLILPLSILYLSQIQISDSIYEKINHNKNTLDETQIGTPLYDRIQHRISTQRTAHWIIQCFYSLLLLIFALLSTSAVVYAIASIYSSKQATFKKVISVVPKVWKRLIVTFFWFFFVLIVYTGFTFGLLILLALAVYRPNGDSRRQDNTFFVLACILGLFYLIGLVYICIVWNLANVISVLEKIYGYKAMKKSRNLIKGKMWVASAIFVKLQICFVGLLAVFTGLVVDGNSVGIVGKVFLGMFCYLLLTILIHIALVTQTIIYFVCKSNHNENIDRPGLAEHLEASYVRLNGDKDIQLGQVPV